MVGRPHAQKLMIGMCFRFCFFIFHFFFSLVPEELVGDWLCVSFYFFTFFIFFYFFTLSYLKWGIVMGLWWGRLRQSESPRISRKFHVNWKLRLPPESCFGSVVD
ncbi:hypothetical protein B9Z19DRAFT_52595 [Tuber borchii]|uniref:Uncharacterized protein n=1 Tax=Tuber borchii TaxID=42251 RepID=A0A2T6ZT37_TUBBO|nr:hypothetical protein B9Z19DRAFT_52595 [Tuber borchii]